MSSYAKDTILLSASQYISTAIGFLTTIIATRILGPEKYGMAVLIMAYPTLLWSFASFKPITITTRYISGFRATKNYDELLSICKIGFIIDFISSGIVFIIVVLTAWWVAGHFYKLSGITWLIVIYGISFIFFSPTGTSRAILNSWQAFRLYAMFQIIERLLQFVFVVGLLLFNYGFAGMVIGTALSHSILGISMVYFSTRVLRREGIGLWYKSSIKQVNYLFKELKSLFSWNYLLITLTGIVEQFPVMLLGKYRSPEEAGFFRLAANIATVSSYFESSLKRIVFPRLSEAFELHKFESMSKKLKLWSLKYGLALGVLIITGIILMPFLVPLFFSKKYIAMVSLVQVMMCGYVISGIFFWVESVYYASKQIKLWTTLYSIFAVVTILLSYIIITSLGSLGMAVLITMGKTLFILTSIKTYHSRTKESKTVFRA